MLTVLCLLAGYAAAEDASSTVPATEPPAGVLVNGESDASGESDIQGMQERLIALGLLTGAADGHFGDATEEAVKLFQQMYGLGVTGYADEATLAALSTAQEGVLEVQEGLIAAGVLSGAADGVLGSATTEAIATFQQMYGLEPTGVADPETRSLLSTASNVIYGVQTKLIELAYLAGAVDGVLGPATETAISEFQQMHGLAVTGVADPGTRDLLMNGTSLICLDPAAGSAEPACMSPASGRRRDRAHLAGRGSYSTGRIRLNLSFLRLHIPYSPRFTPVSPSLSLRLQYTVSHMP